jgi:hypothetical protein
MKNFCNMASLVFLFAVFANAQEMPLPLANDSSLAITPDSSLAVMRESSPPIVQETPLQAAKAITQEPRKMETKPEYMEYYNMRNNMQMLASSEKDFQRNLRVGAYLHLFPLAYGAAEDMFMFSATVEVPLSLSNSVTVQPTIWLGSSNGYVLDLVKYEKLKKVGLGIGMRRYARDRGQGFYLQAIVSAYYISAESIESKGELLDDDYYNARYEYDTTTYINVKGMTGDLIFYIGSTHKWQNIAFFYEGGLGFGYDGTDTYQLGYINSLALNFNVGLGIPF